MLKMTKKQKSWIVIFALLVAVAGAELFCRFYLGLGDPPISIPDAEIDYIFAPNQDCSRFGNTVIYNNLSMRCELDLDIADKPSRVFVVGDSVINGGVLTDQSDLATTLLQKKRDPIGKDWQVCNVSAGSWGPGNYAAFFRRHRNHVRTNDVLIVEVNSHDLWEDDPLLTAGRNVGRDIALPDRKPCCALWDGFHRYFLPRLRKWCGKAQVNTKVDIPKWQTDAGNESAKYNLTMLDEVFSLPCRRKALLIYRSRIETQKEIESVGERAFREWAEDKGLPIIKPVLNVESDYRDKIHPSVSGQRKIADAIEAWL